MNISIVNASPKSGENSTEQFASGLAEILHPHEISHLRINHSHQKHGETYSFDDCDALVLCFPLYIDAVPSHFIPVLQEWEVLFKTMSGKKPKVYAIVNCGFFEEEHNHIVFEIVKNWCHRAELEWGMGLGIGAGGVFAARPTDISQKRPKKNIGRKMRMLADAILCLDSGDTMYISPNFPKFLYILMGNYGWVHLAKKNGIKKNDIRMKP